MNLSLLLFCYFFDGSEFALLARGVAIRLIPYERFVVTSAPTHMVASTHGCLGQIQYGSCQRLLTIRLPTVEAFIAVFHRAQEFWRTRVALIGLAHVHFDAYRLEVASRIDVAFSLPAYHPG